jgi:hypothetical protein
MKTETAKLRSVGGLIGLAATVLLSGCHGGNSGTTPPPAPSADPISVTGVVSDGPVVGGRIFAFAAGEVSDAMASGASADDRAGALAAANPVAALQRSAGLDDTFSLDVPAELEGEALFLAFDRADAEDQRFKDVPPNLESVALIGAPGSSQTINISLHTTLIARVVRARLDPDGDGTAIRANAVAAAIQAAELDVLAAFGHDDTDADLFEGERPIQTANSARLHAASTLLGHELRSVAALHDLSLEDVLAAVAADGGAGVFVGGVPCGAPPPNAASAAPNAAFLAQDVAPGLQSPAGGPS